jgi:hypothetical protein
MFRHLIFSLPLLALSTTGSADDVASTAAPRVASTGAPRQEAHKQEAPAAASAKQEKQATRTPASDKKAGEKPEGDVKMSGMSILGNDEAPKSLVIVPWKSSQLGDTPAISRLLDDSTQPVDKEVFMRELAYYEIRSNSK